MLDILKYCVLINDKIATTESDFAVIFLSLESIRQGWVKITIMIIPNIFTMV